MIHFDDSALKQAIGDYIEKVIVFRKINRGYDMYGRIKNELVKQKIEASIIPSSNALQQQEDGHGQLVIQKFDFNAVGFVNFVYEGDVIYHNKYKYLKVADITDTTAYGTMSATLTRINSTELRKILPPEDIVYDE